MPTTPAPHRRLRLWPGVTAAVLLLVAWLAVPRLIPEAFAYGMFGAILAALVILLWWLFFSRAAWLDRLGGIVLMLVVGFGTSRLLHPSIAGGMMGLMFPIFATQTMMVALVAWAVATRRLAAGARRAAMAAAIIVGCGLWTLVRTEGVTGNSESQLKWRWTRTAEEQLLAQQPGIGTREAAVRSPELAGKSQEPGGPNPTPSAPAAAKGADVREPRPAAPPPEAALSARDAAPAEVKATTFWPGFRGAERDGIIRDVRIEEDWATSPPVELWRRAIGPGWSSFAVRGNLLYTQEQRGDYEIVSCYNVSTGEPVWQHRDAVRFYESNGGAGPRATPTLSEDRVYALGATGILNVLDAANGSLLWSHNVASDTDTKVPVWGFSGSPLIVDDVVIVAASGTLAAYDRRSGKRRWVCARSASYSSPHLATIAGVPQVLQVTDSGVISVSPADGTRLWQHAWAGEAAIVQPAVVSDGQVLVSVTGATGGMGVRRLAVVHGPAGWTVTEVWTTNGLKPYFNDFVVHEGHAYGFDGSILACVDLQDGKRKWKGGRYGNGQLVLLANQGLLLVVSEEGELALVKAAPDQFTELARRPGLDGKTWNHPVLAGDILLARNDREMAAFRLTLARR